MPSRSSSVWNCIQYPCGVYSFATLPPALITVTVKYINKRTKSLQQLNWNNFSLKRARELDQIAVKSNCHLFLTFIHNSLYQMQSHGRLCETLKSCCCPFCWMLFFFVALCWVLFSFVALCWVLFLFVALCWIFFLFVALFVESCFYLLPFLLSVVCRWDWFHLFAVHHLP